MTMEEIIRGETKTVEFKETLPSHSERYMKTVIAYVNTQGGKETRWKMLRRDMLT